MYSVISHLPFTIDAFTHSLIFLIVLYSLYSYMYFHYTFLQKMTVVYSQICVLGVNVVQTARTSTPVQKTTRHHHLKEEHFGRAARVKQLAVVEEQVVAGRPLAAVEQVVAGAKGTKNCLQG
jgi:hypothetical protein